MASIRLQRRLSKLPYVIPKARRTLNFDREDGGDKVPTDWAQLVMQEEPRIFGLRQRSPRQVKKSDTSSSEEDSPIDYNLEAHPVVHY